LLRPSKLLRLNTVESSLAEAARKGETEAWLSPVVGGATSCGPNLEYDDDFLNLVRAAEGKAQGQFTAGEPPNWLLVREKAENLLERTRDLRLAVFWTRARVNLEGLAALGAGLSLVDGLLVRFWDDVHPTPDTDDEDQSARLNVLAMLCHADGLCGDLKRAVLFNVRGAGELRLRSVAVAHGLLPALPEEPVYSREELSRVVADAIARDASLAAMPRAALAAAKSLEATLQDRFGAAVAPDLQTLVDWIQLACGLMPASAPASMVRPEVPAGAGKTDASSGAEIKEFTAPRAPLDVRSRDDALRAIDLVCEFLERTEPSNPAQFLLRRARRLINQDFLQLIKELAPDALQEASRVLGVDPDSVIAR
jgi:type VI secretion system protein ImpA